MTHNNKRSPPAQKKTVQMSWNKNRILNIRIFVMRITIIGKENVGINNKTIEWSKRKENGFTGCSKRKAMAGLLVKRNSLEC